MPRTATKRNGRRNPVESAAALSEAFLGRPGHRITEVVEEMHEHGVLSDFAPLLALYISQDGGMFERSRKPKDCVVIQFERATRLAYTEPGTQQIYIVGGDQTLDLSCFPDVDPEKDSVVIGPVAFIEYFTAKQHLGEEDKKPGPYIHSFSEESKGPLPILCYDVRNGLCSLVGGSYRVDIDMDGKYSAGIRN